MKIVFTTHRDWAHAAAHRHLHVTTPRAAGYAGMHEDDPFTATEAYDADGEMVGWSGIWPTETGQEFEAVLFTTGTECLNYVHAHDGEI